MFWFCVVLGSLLEVVGDYFFKKGTLPIGAAFYLTGTIFWAVSLRYEGLAIAVTIFTLINLLLGVLMGIFLFGEALTVIQWVGASLGIIAIALLCC